MSRELSTPGSGWPSTAIREEATKPLGRPGRVVLGVLLVFGVVVGAPSGFGLFWFVPYGGVGALLAVRRPQSSIGWILLALGLGFASINVPVSGTADDFAMGRIPVPTAILAVATSALGSVGFGLLALLALVLPSGRLPRGRWGIVLRSCLVPVAFVVGAGCFMPMINVNLWADGASTLVRNPAAIAPDLGLWQVITPDTTVLAVLVLLAVAVIALLVRFRTSTGVERQQLRWITAALGFVVAAVTTGFVLGSLIPPLGDTGLQWLGAVLAFPSVPVAIGVAVLRYRLYEIDRIISRVVGWAVISAILGAVFAGAIVALQAVLAPLTNSNTLAVAASTLVAATLFQPVRRRVQSAVDHRFNRSRYDAERIVAGLAGRLRDVTNLAAINGHVVDSVDRSLRPADIGIWVRGESS